MLDSGEDAILRIAFSTADQLTYLFIIMFHISGPHRIRFVFATRHRSRRQVSQFSAALALAASVLFRRSFGTFEEDPLTHIVVLPNYQEDVSTHQETLENLGLFLFRQSRVVSNAQDKAEHLMAESRQLFEDSIAIYPLPLSVSL